MLNRLGNFIQLVSRAATLAVVATGIALVIAVSDLRLG